MVYYGYSFLMSAQRDSPLVHFLRILTSIRFLKYQIQNLSFMNWTILGGNIFMVGL